MRRLVCGFAVSMTLLASAHLWWTDGHVQAAAGDGGAPCEPAPIPSRSTNPRKDSLPTLHPYVDPLPLPRRALPTATTKDKDGTRVEHYRIAMKRSTTQLHSEISSPTPIFGYGGTFPGPSLDVAKDTKVVVEWVNQIGPLDPNLPQHILSPVVVTPTSDVPFPQDWPGAAGGQPSMVPPAPIWTVVHLHGGVTPPGSDGWPDDAYPYPQGSVFTYPGQPRGTLLWYHDHADMITRLNVGAGLAGLYLVRDQVEHKLGLPRLRYGEDGVPHRMPHELPLLIQDRNLDLDESGQFNGKMLHKLASDGAEFYGPYTLVNGKIWPYVDVEPRQVRLRLLNGSNGRFYRLKLRVDERTTSTREFRQIGTDSGLLDRPVNIPASGLTLAPAERADVILDLRGLAGKRVSLVNDYPIPMAPVPPGSDNVLNPPIHEEVIQFRVAANCHTPDTLDLDRAFQSHKPELRPKPADATVRRKIYLIEDPPGTLTINGRLFHDRVEEVTHLGDTEIWEVVNTTADFHPFHIHLVGFEVIERQQFRYADGFDVDKWVATFRLWQAADPSVRLPDPPGIVLTNQTCPIDDNEKGLKDTVRVGPGAVTRILVKFGPLTGRYIYHCHVLEHEDMEMMRPYMILPQGLDLMGANMGPGSVPAASAAGAPAPGHAAGMAMPRAGVRPRQQGRMPAPTRTQRRRVPR